MRLTDDEQWAILEPLIPAPKRRPDGRGRPWRGNRECLEGILWVLKTGARWRDLPRDYPPYQTCHRRFQQWAAAGVFAALAEQLLKLKVSDPDLPNLSECFVDATFAPAKKGAIASGRPRKAKAPR
jgi:hypothetical protein